MEQAGRRYSIHREAEYNRLRKNTLEHEFVERLEREFEFSPRESRGALRGLTVRLQAVARKREVAARQMEEMEMVRVIRLLKVSTARTRFQ